MELRKDMLNFWLIVIEVLNFIIFLLYLIVFYVKGKFKDKYLIDHYNIKKNNL